MSLIRASIQLSPKSKVVDFFVLYNFYFGQISCWNVKFGVLDGQSRLKVTQSRSTGTPLFVLGSPPAIDVGVATRRADEPRPSCSHTVLIRAESCSFSPPRSPSSRRTECTAEPSNPSYRSPRRCRFRPPLAAVPRFLALQAAQPRPTPSCSISCSIEPSAGRN